MDGGIFLNDFLYLIPQVLDQIGGLLTHASGFASFLQTDGDTTGGFVAFGDGFISDDIITYMLEMKRQITGSDKTGILGVMVRLAKIIAGFLCMIHFAAKAYNYMLGEEEWKIMPLLRPFALLMVIMFWGGFCSAVQWPALQVEQASYDRVKQINKDVGEQAKERWEKMDVLTARIYTKAAMVDKATDSWQNDNMLEVLVSSMSVTDYNDLTQKLIAGGSWVFKAFMWGFTMVIEKLAMVFLQFSIVLIIMMQILFLSILYIIGPLSFGFSVIGIWKNSWSAWVSRYLSTTFYTVVLFVALSIIYVIIKHILESELEFLDKLIAETDQPLEDWDMFYEYAGALTGRACLFVVAIMAACGVTMYVPVCSTWIVETSGTAQAATGFTAGVSIVAMGASSVTKMGGSLAKGAANGLKGGGE